VSNFLSREQLRPNSVLETLLAEEIFDRLQQAMASDPTGFCELYRDYLSDAGESLVALRLACEQNQAETLCAKAHYLKSSSLVLGLRPVAQCCADLQELGRNGNFKAAVEKVAETAELLESVRAELERKLGPGVIPSAA